MPEDHLTRLTLHSFAGTWSIARRIDDFAARRLATLDGTATLSPAPWGLAYVETGTLHIEGQAPMAASRAYRWALRAGKIEVLFDDGRPFHVFDPSADRSSATFHCGDDEYRVIYTFSRWPGWRSIWRVIGPRKDYRLETEYARAR